MADVAKLVTQITADASKFKAEISSAKNEMGSFVSVAKAGSVAVIAAFAAITTAAGLITREIFKSADAVSELYDNTQKIGTTVAAFQELAIAARESGVSSDELQNLLGTLNKNLGEAQLSGGKAATALRALGISFAQLNALPTDQKFELIASKLKDLRDVQLETVIASDLMGKAGKNGIALFNSNIDESIQKVHGLGITLTQSQAEGLDKLSETKDLIGSIWAGFKDNVSAEVAPAFQELLDGIVGAVKNMGGLKEAAKSTADFIVAAMHAMGTAITNAMSIIKAAKKIYDEVSDSYAGDLAYHAKGLLETYVKGVTYPGRTVISALSGAPRIGEGSRAKSVDASNFAPQETTSKIQNIQQTDAATRALAVYKSETAEAAKAMKDLKEQAMKTAAVLDGFHAIKDALAGPGKEQADSIIKQAVGSLDTKLAPSEQFQQIFTRALKEAQTGDMSNIQQEIKSLEGIIAQQKEGINYSGNKGGTVDYNYSPNQDISGLVTALNELKVFLASKSGPKDQVVDVRIKVDAGKDFVTTVTTSQSFKQAVDKEFDDRTAAAARGNIP